MSINCCFKEEKNISVALIQTSLFPEEKDPYFSHGNTFVSPLIQWKRILLFLKEKKDEKIDLLVLPETAISFGAFESFYPMDSFLSVWIGYEAMRMRLTYDLGAMRLAENGLWLDVGPILSP